MRLTGRGAHCGCWAPRVGSEAHRLGSSLWVLGQRVGSEAHRSGSSLWVLGQRVGSETGSQVREHIVGAWP